MKKNPGQFSVSFSLDYRYGERCLTNLGHAWMDSVPTHGEMVRLMGEPCFGQTFRVVRVQHAIGADGYTHHGKLPNKNSHYILVGLVDEYDKNIPVREERWDKMFEREKKKFEERCEKRKRGFWKNLWISVTK